MKKKLLAVIAAMAMVVSSAVTAFALPSTQAMQVEIISAEDASGKDMKDSDCHEVQIRPIQEKDKDSVAEVSKQSNLKKVLGDSYVKGLQVIHKADIYIWDVAAQKEIAWDAGAEYHFPITVTFKVPGVKKDSKVQILQGYDGYNGNAKDGVISLDEWHTVKIISVGENTITVEFTHMSAGSPLLFLMDGSDIQAPTTGEFNVMLIAGAIAVVALVGVVLTKKGFKAAR